MFPPYTNLEKMKQTLFNKGEVVQVLTPEPVNGGFLDYIVSKDGMILGSFVEVPIASRTCVGVLWGKGKNEIEKKKLRNIIRVLSIDPMSPELRTFLYQVAHYTINPLYKVIKLSIGGQNLLRSEPKKKLYYLGNPNFVKLTPTRKKVIDFLKKDPQRKYQMHTLTRELGVSSSVINSLIETGNISFCLDSLSTEHSLCRPIFSKDLSDEQKMVSDNLRRIVTEKAYSTSLLRGVTGSGKTEVYLDAVSESLSLGKQVLVLVPEIVLSIDFVERVFKRYGVLPGQWHSGVSDKQRRSLYRAVASNRSNLVIGARSALFLPYSNLGLVVVDEEHDSSYKQDDGVCYNARDMAVLRASLSDAKVILASATPSLETWANTINGKYNRFDLFNRYGSAVLPKIEIIDLRSNGSNDGRFLSNPLKIEIQKRIDLGEQSLLFLNRRGYAPITVCKACGFQIGCKNCDARLVHHKFEEKLICHQCGYKSGIPTSCPNCNEEGKLTAVGPGIERLQEECIETFPGANIGILSSDTVDNILSLRKKIEEFKSGDTNIIIGTQLISKGHNFPKITLVGVIDGDLGLQGGDLRAAEKMFQSLRQVSGRAGRNNTPGKALIQTYCPDHPVIKALSSDDDDTFWNLEAKVRSEAEVPPFGRLVALILSGKTEQQLFEIGRQITNMWQKLGFGETRIFGPSLAPVSRIRNRYRVRLLIKAKKNKNVQAMIRRLIEKISIPSAVRMTVDVDPQNFY